MAFLRKARGEWFSRQTCSTKLRKKRCCCYSFIFRFSRKFGTFHILSFASMELVPGSYDHFQNWFRNERNKRYNSRATSLWKDDRIFLQCNYCSDEYPITPNGIYWNIGNFTSHLKHSPDCMSLRDSDNTIPMDSSDSVTVSLTFDFIPHTKYNKTQPGVEPAALYCPWSFDFML